MTQSFELVKDPRISTSDADFAEQFDFLIQIRDKLSEIVTGVNTIRSLKRQLADWAERLSNSEVDASDAIAATKTLSDEVKAVEDELVQVEFTADGDTLNYREKLFEKLSALASRSSPAPTPGRRSSRTRCTASSPARPTNSCRALQALIDGDVADMNAQLAELGVGIIGV